VNKTIFAFILWIYFSADPVTDLFFDVLNSGIAHGEFDRIQI
jgi:hypothetical protein